MSQSQSPFYVVTEPVPNPDPDKPEEVLDKGRIVASPGAAWLAQHGGRVRRLTVQEAHDILKANLDAQPKDGEQLGKKKKAGPPPEETA